MAEFKGQFSLIPAGAATHVCEGECGEELDRRSFPTTTGPERRTGECRSCRDTRQGRAEKAAEKASAAAEAAAKKAQQKADRAAKAKARREAKKVAA